jgi:hypothetical protein
LLATHGLGESDKNSERALMANNKKHHYVPKLLLRNFSTDPDRKQINLFNIKRLKFISAASIDGQCYKDYFYGKEPTLEKTFGKLESLVSVLFKNAIKNSVLPSRHTVDFINLISFIALQLGRTVAAEEETNEGANQIAKYMLGQERPDLLPDMAKFEIQIKNAVLMPIFQTLIMSPILLDLECKLLVTNEGSEFRCQNFRHFVIQFGNSTELVGL